MFDSNMSELDKLKLNVKALSAQLESARSSVLELTDQVLMHKTNLKLLNDAHRELAEVKQHQDKLLVSLNSENAEIKKQLSSSEPVDAA